MHVSCCIKQGVLFLIIFVSVILNNHIDKAMSRRLIAFLPCKRQCIKQKRSTALFLNQDIMLKYHLSTQTDQQRRALRVVDSHGNYQEDAQRLEDPHTMPLYSAQKSLPRLPVPSLTETVDRFLPTALPLATSEEEAESLKEAAAQFPHQAKELQRRLLERSKQSSNTSWLQHWWNTMGYLQVRDPIVVHVSYFFRCNDDPLLEKNVLQQPTNKLSPPYQPCIARSAAILPPAIQYVQSLCQMEPSTIGKNAKIKLCSSQMKYMFRSCRIPQKFQDKYHIYCPSQEHVVIAVRGQFFAVDIDENASLCQQQWRHILQHCIDQTDPGQRLSTPSSLGYLTAMARDDWADARMVLLQQGGKAMEAALEKLESSMFMLSMDIDEEIQTDRERALQFWHGCSDTNSNNNNKSYLNRYYDKSAAILVTQNGKLGFQGEHSMLDGMPFVEFCDDIVNQGIVEEDCLDASTTSSPSNANSSDNLPKITNIFEDAFASMPSTAQNEIDKWLDKAKVDFGSLVTKYELHAQNYLKYGSTVMKQAGCSPDAYTQMAMQVASYRMFGEPMATYESTQVRKFLHGRTETTRTVSPDSLAFCQAMDDPNKSRSEKFELLQKACYSHVHYIRHALEGLGVDRHFFGLTMCVQDGEHPPDLLTHPLYEKAKRFRLSTSSLPNMAVGFGPVVDDGFGIGYEAKPTSCIFHVTAQTKYEGWTEQLCQEFSRALDDMRNLYDLDKKPRSRL